MKLAERFEIQNLDPELIKSERDRIFPVLQRILPFAKVIEVGSTAVEGVIGKQDIDFLARVPRNLFHAAKEALDQNFYRNERQFSAEDFQGYRVSSPLDIAIQLTAENGEHDVFERFLTLLRSDPELRRTYNELKVAFNLRPMDEYRVAKGDFIKRALANK
jgi:GrpB-like predicted nucleotidyltransferase (UPF0157 family)